MMIKKVPYEKYNFTGKLTDGLCYTAAAKTFEVWRLPQEKNILADEKNFFTYNKHVPGI